MLRVKQLQNQLADAHFHLNELSNENKLLKAIQKRQDAALRRYEGSNAELPRIINSHQQDLRVLQTKYKQLKSQCSRLSDTLKDRDSELQSLQAQNRKLSQLSKDRHLGERAKLQTQVLDLTHRINEQDQTIQTLRRKLELETKYLRHQLHAEMAKHKESQKGLEHAQNQLQRAEQLSEQRLKRSYQASQLACYSKARASVTSQSLTNLTDSPSEHAFKLHSFRKLTGESTTNQSLPSLNAALSTRNRSNRSNHSNLSQDTCQSANLDAPSSGPEASRDAALLVERSPASLRVPPALLSTSRSAAADSPIDESLRELEARVKTAAKSDVSLDQAANTRELPKSLKNEFEYSADDEKSSNNGRSNSNDSLNEHFNYATRSRSLHARLVNSATNGVRASKTTISSRSRSLTKENLENIMENERDVKCDRDSVVTVISKDTLAKDDVDVHTNDSNSDIESEMEIPLAYTAEQDDNNKRKSDVIIEDVEIHRQPSTSSHLSSLFTHLRKPPNYSFTSKKIEPKLDLNSINSKEINGSIISTAIDNDDESSNLPVTHKRSFSNNTIKASWDDDFCMQDKNKQSNNENSSSGSEQLQTKDQEHDIASFAEKLLHDITENLSESKQLENNTVNKSISNNVRQNNSGHSNVIKSDVENTVANKIVDESANKSFDKAKLLAAMKAIDDNDNIEFVDQKTRKNSASNRLRITENLYRGVPTHKKKSELMKELFSDANLDNNEKDK